MLSSRRRISTTQILTICIFVTLLLYFRSIFSTSLGSSGRSFFDTSGTVTQIRPSSVKPANSTLGFGYIVAVAGPNSPRKWGLTVAANVSDLEIVIPEQPPRTEDDVNRFRLPESKFGRGSILAWLAHNNAINWFLNTGAETALILEDDVDWDIRIRTRQIPLVAANFRALLPRASSRHYWGDQKDWDLLYIGNCGDYFNSLQDGVGIGFHNPENLTSIPHALFADTTMPERLDLHPFTASLFSALRIPEYTRVLHRSRFPLCTFGYALSRTGALKIVNDVAPPHEPDREGSHAYDVQILVACMNQQLRCWTVAPELFHHMEGGSMIASVEEEPVGRPPVDVAGTKQVWARRETSNIGCGFWSGDFDFPPGDEERMRFLQEEVGRKGKCLKPGRDGRQLKDERWLLPLGVVKEP